MSELERPLMRSLSVMRRPRHSRVGDPGDGATDEDVLRELHRQHGRALLGALMRLTAGDRERSERLVGEVLREATRQLDALAANSHDVRLWLFKLAQQAAAHDYRGSGHPPGAPDAGAVDAIGRMVVAFDVQEAMTDLRAEHRDVLVELYFRGRSAAELATRLGVPVATITTRAYYAVRALRLALEERGAAAQPS